MYHRSPLHISFTLNVSSHETWASVQPKVDSSPGELRAFLRLFQWGPDIALCMLCDHVISPNYWECAFTRGRRKKGKKKRIPEAGLPEERLCLRFGRLVELGA